MSLLAPRGGAQRVEPVAARGIVEDVAPWRVSSREPAVTSAGLVVAGLPRSTAPLVSLAIPGLGQAMLNQDRSIAYFALETFALLQYLKDNRELSRERRLYRSLARDVARAPFSGSRPDGNWSYYEAMESYLESGEFSLSDAGLVPETDTLTYNGSRWILARRTHWANPFVAPAIGSPAFEAAIDFYLEKAVRTEFRWTWRNAQLQHDLYRRSIDRANDSARRSKAALTLLVANHLLSAVDALATVRLEETAAGPTGRETRLRVAIPVGH